MRAVQRPGHAEDAARLGRQEPQRRRARQTRRGRRRQDDHRARAHALPVLQGQRRLERRARSDGRRIHSRHRQRRHHVGRRRRRGARCFRRRRRHDRPWRLWRAVAAGPHRRLLGDEEAPRRAFTRRAGADRVRAFRGDADALRRRSRPAQRAQAHRLVPGEERPQPPTPSRRGAASFAPPTTPRACSTACPLSTTKLARRPHEHRHGSAHASAHAPPGRARHAAHGAAAPDPRARRGEPHRLRQLGGRGVPVERHRPIEARQARRGARLRLPAAGAGRAGAQLRLDGERVRRRGRRAEVSKPQTR